MSIQTPNPFDFAGLFKNYDPQAFLKQIQNGFSAYQLPNLDTSALMESQKKNVEALVAANQAAFSGTQELLKQQGEMMQQAITDATEAANALAGSSNPKDLAAKQAELVQAAFEKALANSTELSELVKKNQDEVSGMVNQRVSESLKEIKDAISKLG
ncbi:MAG: phasin family protein [Gammaproteobacteria bacterium]|nr:phasin family protein [Gammaproteobacteria bacterium]